MPCGHSLGPLKEPILSNEKTCMHASQNHLNL